MQQVLVEYCKSATQHGATSTGAADRVIWEHRELLATDLASIAGVAFIDQAGDGFSASDPPVAVGTQVQLFLDNRNGGTALHAQSEEHHNR